MTILAGAERIIRGRRRQVNRKWPRWFTPNWVSNPSSVLPWGHAIIPETFSPHDSRLDIFCNFRLGTQFAWPVYGWWRVRLVFMESPTFRPSVCVFFLCVIDFGAVRFWIPAQLSWPNLGLMCSRYSAYITQMVRPSSMLENLTLKYWTHNTYKIFRT